ncbi:hypothetical protein MEQU1_002905 [Malassezia equina]|uniref:DUF3835 domain-containing protein n=1 Tax=Malassezia equina TaxID=1381935 RepID=A0AAF0EEP4_9BASI|nr:hypothetical protein MEQU1_002905 [Malassezia equina]
MENEAQQAQAAQPDVVAAARALLTRLQRLHALHDRPYPWDTSALHVDDRTALAHAQAPNEAQAVLTAHIQTLEKQMAEYKAQFGAQVREAYATSMRNVLSDSAEAADQDPVLNEEGLPFVDPLEMLPDSPPETPQLDASTLRPTSNVLGRTPGQVAPFDPTMQGEERQQWMASIFDELQKEEDEEMAKEQAKPKALKVSGLRRGFLQGQKLEEPPKKQVRIVEPDLSSDEEERSDAAAQRPEKVPHVPLGMDPEDAGVQEEAARIVDLLGPEVIRGHPNAERIFAEMEAAQPHMVQKAAPAPRPPTEPAKPAIRDTVVERSADASTRRTPSSGRKPSAFKQRQLDRQQGAEDEAPVAPVGPSISQGLSAIERAGRVDDCQSESRVHAGLPPRAPHARPTKAYAAKLQQRAAAAAGNAPPTNEEEEIQTPGRRVRFGGEEVCHMDDDMDEAEEDESLDHMSGDIDDDDEYHQEPDDDDESVPEDTWTSEDEMLWDSEDEYGPKDLEALKPQMDGHPSDSFWNEDLAREYAEAKARLALQPSSTPPAPSNEAEDNQEDYGIAPLDASVTNAGRPRVSRFKAARLAGERVPDPNGEAVDMERPRAEAADERGHDLAHELREGRTPVMVLPSLAPVRFPRPTKDGTRGIDLDGESDDDDERLHALMRARLSMQGAESDQGRERKRQPPEVGRAT